MSAFMVDDGHIDYLVAAIRLYRVQAAGVPLPGNPGGWERIDLTEMTDSELGRALLQTNLTSMMARYSDSLSEGELNAPEAYAYRRPQLPVTPVQVLKAIHCYEYQACEFDGWSSSLAHDIVTRLASATVGKLPGYEAAAWEITRPTTDRQETP